MAIIGKWVKATAMLVGIEAVQKPDYDQKKYRRIVKYSVDGVEYTRTETQASNLINDQIGDHLEIVYNPDRPKAFMLEVNQKQQALRQKYIIVALCGAGILLLCIALALI